MLSTTRRFGVTLLKRRATCISAPSPGVGAPVDALVSPVVELTKLFRVESNNLDDKVERAITALRQDINNLKVAVKRLEDTYDKFFEMLEKKSS